MKTNVFKFKQFEISHTKSAMKVGTDGVLLGAWARGQNCHRILDIGTGTGLVALMLAQRYEKAIIDAVEVDVPSFEEATANFIHSPWTNRLKAFNTSIQAFHAEEPYDLIVSNPPFFIKGTPAPTEGRHRARHTASLSQGELLEATYQLLAPDGSACFILPISESQSFIASARRKELFLTHKTTFISKEGKPPERFLMRFSKSPAKIIEDKLLHYNPDGSWSSDYKALTKAFHPQL